MKNLYRHQLNMIAVSFAHIISQELEDEELGLLANLFRLTGEAMDALPRANAVRNNNTNNNGN